MSDANMNKKVCIVIGASHAGVNFAFALRREGWQGEIILIDADSELPYHRPPLSKTYLSGEEQIDKIVLKPRESYKKEDISLFLGLSVRGINCKDKSITLEDGSIRNYDKLVIATGARPIIPKIAGIEAAKKLFPLRTAADVAAIRNSLAASKNKQVAIIGGGYIGLETAASLNKLGAEVTVLEREERILARVTAAEMSAFFADLHEQHGVAVLTSKNVIEIKWQNEKNELKCSDGSVYRADLVIIGVGIHVNQELAAASGINVENGVIVDAQCKTNMEDVYAIGDCTFHHNPHYNRFIRLESVQNAVDQAKVAAAAICGKQIVYDAIPWFWSDQYDIKLQMVGLSDGYDQALVRKEEGNLNSFSIWYFKKEELLAVDAVNNTKAYVYGTKILKGNQRVDKKKLAAPTEELKLPNILVE